MNFPKLRPLVVLDDVIVHEMLVAHIGDLALDPLLGELIEGVSGCYSVKDGS